MLVSNGNMKIGKDTLIFNIQSATDCISRKLGLCKVPDKCYAMKSERMYKQVLPYRRRQEKEWDEKGFRQLATELKGTIERKRVNKIKYVRFNEAGDFRDQEDVKKLYAIAQLLPDVIFYGYTARKDLDWLNRPKNVIVNGSGFMVDNSFTVIKKNEIDGIICPGNCRNCHLCKSQGGRDIKVKVH